MNELYTTIEAVINQGDNNKLHQLINALNEKPGDSSKQYSVGENVFYTLRRLLGACLARDTKIKQNSEKALTQFSLKVEDIKNLNKQAFAAFFLSVSDMTECKTKVDQNGFIHGKMIITRVLKEYLQKNEKIIGHFVELVAKNEQFQEQLLEEIYILKGGMQSSNDKLLFGLKMSLTNKKALMLQKILKGKLLSNDEIQQLLKNAIEQYPKQSISLKYFGYSLKKYILTPAQFFKKYYNQYINPDESKQEDSDLKRLFYLLQVQKYFLARNQINKANFSTFFCIEMITVWMDQLRVKNKHMKSLTASIKIKFQQDQEFSFEILKQLHEQNVYLQNISVNHPLSGVYNSVNPLKYRQYLNELISKETQREAMEEDEQKPQRHEEYLSQLQFFVRERSSSFTSQLIGETLTLLIKYFHKSKKSQKLLNLIWSLYHSTSSQSIKNKTNKQKIVLNTKGVIILSKIKLAQLQLEAQQVQVISKALKFLRIKVKQYKQSKNKFMVSFFNFVTSYLMYAVIYIEQTEICSELELIAKDLEAFITLHDAKSEGKDVIKKKRKKSQQVEDPKKPIHVLVDVFISLLTKAPAFLRNFINLMFEQMVPYLQTSDLDTLLDVIQKPDQEYIEQI